MAILLVLALLLVGVVVTTLGFHGPPVLSEPRCANCGYDLRGFANPMTRCSECGSDLTARHGVKWGAYRRRPKFIGVGILLMVVPGLLVFVAISHLRSRAPTAPFSVSRSNSAVLASLATTTNQPWDWNELNTRLGSGKLSQSETKQAIDLLIAAIKRPTPRQPLTWSDGFITTAENAGFITKEQYLRLAQSFYGTGNLLMPKKVRQGSVAGFTLDGASPWQLPGAEFVRALRQIKLADGREVPAFSVNERRGGGAHDPDHLSAGHSQEIAGTMMPNLPAGNYVLTFLIDAGVLDSQTVPRMVFDKPGQARNWPHGRARWTEQISMPLTILPADQSPVQTITDSNLDPRAAIQIKAVRVTLSGTGRLLSLDISIRNCHIPCSFDTVLRVADREYPIGPVSTGGGGEWSLRTSGKVPSFPANIGSADVLLRPNPSLVEGRFGFDRIWGNVIEIKNIPMQRYDLEAASQSPAPDGPP